jgi:hypothetical protein
MKAAAIVSLTPPGQPIKQLCLSRMGRSLSAAPQLPQCFIDNAFGEIRHIDGAGSRSAHFEPWDIARGRHASGLCQLRSDPQRELTALTFRERGCANNQTVDAHV